MWAVSRAELRAKKRVEWMDSVTAASMAVQMAFYWAARRETLWAGLRAEMRVEED